MTSKLDILNFKSDILKNNPLGDPTTRRVYVYTPEGYDENSQYPALLALTGFGGTGAILFNPDPLAEDLKERMDRLIRTGTCPPCLIIAPDCFTRYGGSQYLNSTATGNYEDYLTREIVPFIEKSYRVRHWGVFGKSSGGYGAILLGMKHPTLFKALAMHSGDSNFELCYLPDMGKTLNAFHQAGGPEKWFEKFSNDINKKRREYMDPLNMLAMTACYSPQPSNPLGIDFPFDLETGEFRADVWSRWQTHDPVRLVDKYQGNLKQLKALFVDCGTKDEFYLQWGARALVKKLRQQNIETRYEEFNDTHLSISYRYDVSIPFLVKSLEVK